MRFTPFQLWESLSRNSINKDIENYISSTSLKYNTNDNYSKLATYIYKDLSISNLSEENKNYITIISNDVKFLLGEPLNDKNAGISTFVKTIPVLINIYSYSDTVTPDQRQLIEQYIYNNINMANKDYSKIPESGFLEGYDKLNLKIPKALPIEVQNKLKEFAVDYKNAVLSKPKLESGSNNLLIIIIILLILIGLGFFYFKSKSKVSFGKRRRRV